MLELVIFSRAIYCIEPWISLKKYATKCSRVLTTFLTMLLQAEVLYRCVEEQCGLKGDGSEVILDLFCGTGTIGLSMAKK